MNIQQENVYRIVKLGALHHTFGLVKKIGLVSRVNTVIDLSKGQRHKS